MKAGVIGFMVGAAVPAGFGIWMWVQIVEYNASHPVGPDNAGCGMPMLAALGMITVVAPVAGLVSGAACYFVASFSRHQREAAPQ